MSTVKKPILLDETGKEIVSALRTNNAMLSAIARESISKLSSWKDIQALVRQGLAKEIFHIGDQFIIPWKDTAADKSYDVPLDVVHFGDVTLKDGSVVPAMFLQWHYTTPFGVQFDHPEDEVADGVFSTDYSYYIKNTDGSFKLLTVDTDYSIGSAIPTDKTYYRSAIKDTTGNICRYGYNRWSHSAMRQFLNSDKGVNAWWVAQHNGDVAPNELATKAGFMTGFEEDFLSCLSPIKVTTALNTVTDSDIGMTEDTYDTFFLPSLEQMYAKPQLAGVEGNYFEYWKRATGATKPNEWYEAGKNPGYITYGVDAKTSPRYVRLRSANRYDSSNTWTVTSTGDVSLGGADYASRCAPVCAVY